jgi:hypothetical protein
VNRLGFAPGGMIEIVGAEINVCVLRRHNRGHAVWWFKVHSINEFRGHVVRANKRRVVSPDRRSQKRVRRYPSKISS